MSEDRVIFQVETNVNEIDWMCKRKGNALRAAVMYF